MSAVLASIAVLTVSGCTQTSDGNATPSSTTSPSGSVASSSPSRTASGSKTAPAITNPLDVSKFMANACLSITAEQAATLTISPQGEPVNIESTPACKWKYGTNLDWEIAVTYIVPDAKNGLQNLYNWEATTGHSGGYFEEATIDGYPAVYQDVSDLRTKGSCQLSVGVNAQVFFTVLNLGPNNTDLCKGADKVANAVVETIKRG